jgi:hypothetical protein
MNKTIGSIMPTYFCEEKRTALITSNNTMRIMGSNVLLPSYKLLLRLSKENEETSDIDIKFVGNMGAMRKVNNSEEGLKVLASLLEKSHAKPNHPVMIEDDSSIVGDEEVLDVEIPEDLEDEPVMADTAPVMADTEVEVEKKD